MKNLDLTNRKRRTFKVIVDALSAREADRKLSDIRDEV
jgi:hypothetical protein